MAVLNHGQLLLHATPEAAIENLEGKIWTTNISSAELPDYQDQYTVLSSAFNRDNSLRIRVLADTAIPEFKVVTPTLEDVYFAALRGNTKDTQGTKSTQGT